LLRLLGARRLTPALTRHLAATAAAAVTAYVRAIGEPYYDFQFDNMLYDEASWTVTFLDVGLPDGGGNAAPNATALEVSLGNLVGSTMFQSARPKWILALRQHLQAAELCAAVVADVMELDATAVSPEGLRDAANAAYARSAFKGGRLRVAWYASAGRLLVRRPVILDRTLAPPRPGSAVRQRS
jgi:hypothetical protein